MLPRNMKTLGEQIQEKALGVFIIYPFEIFCMGSQAWSNVENRSRLRKNFCDADKIRDIYPWYGRFRITNSARFTCFQQFFLSYLYLNFWRYSSNYFRSNQSTGKHCWSISRDSTILLVSLCVHRDAPTIPLGSLCIHWDAPSHNPQSRCPPSTLLPHPGLF